MMFESRWRCTLLMFMLLNGVKGRGFLRLRPSAAAVAVAVDDITSKITSAKIIVVDVGGSGTFTNVQDAIHSIPDGNPDWIVIHVNKGIYREQVRIPREKGHIYLRGSGRTKTTIVWSQSSTLKVEADDFIAFGISFKNEAPTVFANASHNHTVAANVGADRAAFYSCGFYGSLFDNEGRHYYDRCYIQGAIDVVFGHARSVFHECEIFVTADTGGSVTAHTRTSKNENTGFVFLRGRIFGIGRAFLGRPKGDHSRVVFANTYMSKAVRPEGWSDGNHQGSLENVYHAEYNCHGPGSSTEGRAPWLKKLSGREAAPFLAKDFIDGKQWLLV